MAFKNLGQMLFLAHANICEIRYPDASNLSIPFPIFFPIFHSKFREMASSLSTYYPVSSHISKQNHASNLSSSFLSSPSSIPLSSNSNISLQFRCNNKQLCPATPRPLTVIAMAPPKPGGKAKKGTCLYSSHHIYCTNFDVMCAFVCLYSNWSN